MIVRIKLPDILLAEKPIVVFMDYEDASFAIYSEA